VAAAVALIAAACGPDRAPTVPSLPDDASLAAGGNAGGANNKVKLKTLQLASNTLRIDGPSVAATISIGNSGPAIQTGVSIRAEIAQPGAVHEAGGVPTKCAPGDPDGFLSTATCTMTFDVRASNSTNEAGTLVAGLATLRVIVVQTVNGVATDLADKSLGVNLVAGPSISSLTLASTTLAIDGPKTTYTATLENPANSLQNVSVQASIVQGSTRRDAGSGAVICGGSLGVLTPGTCLITFAAGASNQTSGNGTLQQAPATFELRLVQSTNGTTTVFDTKTVNVDLVSKNPKIMDLTLASTTLTIGGASVDYTVQIKNPGFPIGPWVIIQGEMVQDNGQGGQVVRGAGGTLVDCGAGLGTLPTTGTGTCSIQFTVTASGESGFDGVLSPGIAQFVLHLQDAPPNQTPTELDSRTVEVSLVSGAPSITNITPTFSQLVIGGPSASATIEINNPGPQLSAVIYQAWIKQGSAIRAANSDNVSCGGGAGVLTTGTCTTPASVVASNTASGLGTLVPGTATLEIQLKQIDGTTETVLDTKSISITLAPLTPTIVGGTIPGVVQIGVPGTMTIVIQNPTPTTYTNTTLAVNFLQSGVPAPSGTGGFISCGALGQLPPGDCVVSVGFQVGSPYTAGPAQLELRLYTNNGATLLDVKQYNITLVN
jgi:hypothetical protein